MACDIERTDTTKKVLIVIVSAVVMLLPLSMAIGAVNWQNQYTQFAFNIDSNGGLFVHIPSQYFQANSQATDYYAYLPSQGQSDPYTSIAEGELSEFAGLPAQFSMNAMAMATGTSTSPADGLEVRACAQSIPVGLDMNYGVDVEQRVISWVSRYFTVTEAGTYELKGDLSGMVDFNSFNINSQYLANSSITAVISIDELVLDGSTISTSYEVVSIPVTLGTPVSQPVNLSIVNASSQVVTYQLKVNLLLETAITNYNWSGSIEGLISGTFNVGTPAAPIILSASVGEPTVEYTLTTLTPDGNGTLSPPSGDYAENSIVNLVATPASGYQVASWSGTDDDSSTATTNTVTMTEDKTVSVTFQLIQYALTAGVAGGEGTIDPTSGTYVAGTSVSLTATPAAGYEVASWSGTDDDSSTATTNTVTMTSDKTVTVTFQPILHQLTASVAGGQGFIQPTAGTYDEGTVVQLTATPFLGYVVASWSGTDNDSSTATTNTVTMTSDKTVTVTFTDGTPPQYALTTGVAGGEGSIAPTGGSYDEGTQVTLTATPAEGWEVSAWSGTDDDSSTATTNTVTMTSDKTVTVTFTDGTPPQYALTTGVAGGEGSIAPTGGSYDEGTQVTLTATPAEGWEVSAWSGTDDDSSTATTNTVTMSSDKTVSVTFTEVPPPPQYTLTASVVGGEGTVSPTGGSYEAGTQVTLTATPADGYEMASWSGTDDDGSSSTTNTVTMTADKIVTVAFAPITYTLTVNPQPDSRVTVTRDPDKTVYDMNEVVTLTAAANPLYYVFEGWEGDVDDPSSATTTIVMSGDRSVTAVFTYLDSDGDGAADLFEQGDDPDNPDPEFDGNEDGTSDYLQANVASLSAVNGEYATLGAPDGTVLSNVQRVDLSKDPELPAGWEFPLGHYSFEIGGVTSTDPLLVTMDIHGATVPESYYMHGPTPDDATLHWYEFLYDGTTGAIIDGSSRIELWFADGERGDSDLTINGTIADPGGPVVASQGTSGIDDSSSNGGSSSSGGCFLDSVMP